MTSSLKECTTHHLLVLEVRFASCATWCDWSFWNCTDRVLALKASLSVWERVQNFFWLGIMLFVRCPG